MTGGDATSHVEGAVWRVWFPARSGGHPSVVGGPPRQAPPSISPTGPSGGHTADRLWPGEIGSQTGLGCSQVVFLAPPTSLVFLLNWWDSLALGEFGAATLAGASWVSERVHWSGRRPSSSPRDTINCVLGDDSPLGFAVIFSPVGEGWAVDCFPEQFLRQTEMIKRSLWLDDEQTWWCLEPLQQCQPKRPALQLEIATHEALRHGTPKWDTRPALQASGCNTLHRSTRKQEATLGHCVQMHAAGKSIPCCSTKCGINDVG